MEREVVHQIGATRADEPVDVAVDDAANELVLPSIHLALRERALDELAVPAVLGRIHLEDRPPDHLADARAEPRRREPARVLEDLLDEIERPHGVGDAPAVDHLVDELRPVDLVTAQADDRGDVDDVANTHWFRVRRCMKELGGRR